MNFLDINIGNINRKLPLIKSSKFSYYSFNMLGDTELNNEAAKLLSYKIKECDVIVTVESKAIALVQSICSLRNIERYVVIRKSKKSYMMNEVSINGNTIISGNNNYYLDGKDLEYLRNKRIVVIDDVISTCGTINSIYNLLINNGLEIIQFGTVLIEGKLIDTFKNIPIVTCGFIPLAGDLND